MQKILRSRGLAVINDLYFDRFLYGGFIAAALMAASYVISL